MDRRLIATDGLSQSVLEAGEGPLVLLIHGFPELAISWRAQIRAPAQAGYRVVAPDMRGYGDAEKPDRTKDYTILHLVGDMVDLVRALGEQEAVVVGHDWGAAVAWHCALMRPDMFTAVAGLSVPFQPRRPKGPPVAAMRAIAERAGTGDLYITRFQNVDAHEPFDSDPETVLRKMFWAYDGATPADQRHTGFLKRGQSLTDGISNAATLPPWMNPDHFAEYVAAFRDGGFKGPLDWYRCLDLNWSLTAWLQDRTIDVPSLFMTGEHDPVRHYAGRHEKAQADWLTDLRGAIEVPGAGHWLQQERPEAVNAALLAFLAEVRPGA